MSAVSLEHVTVLHVDDEPGYTELVRDLLERENPTFSVRTATSVEDAQPILQTEEVDCVVSDYDMPGRDGLDFLELVRDEYQGLPFILFTGRGSEQIASEAITAGVDDYLQKSAGQEQYALLANRISNAVEKHRSLEEAESTRRFFSKLIQYATDVIPVIDEDGTVTFVSSSAETHLGYRPEDVIGDDVWDYIHPDDLEQTTEKFVETIEDPDSMPEVDFRFKHADGSWVRLHGRAKNLLDDPDVEGVVSYNRIVDE